jgi:hypothetical protein
VLYHFLLFGYVAGRKKKRKRTAEGRTGRKEKDEEEVFKVTKK